MRKQINFFVSDNNELKNKIIIYFEQFGLNLVENNNDHLKFAHDSTLFDTWKANPLHWGSEITVLIKGNNIVTDFYIDNDAQMKTIEEETVWNTFIENFQIFITNGVDHNSKIDSAIIGNKKRRLRYIFWAFLGALIGCFLVIIYNKLTNNNSMISIFLIPIVATTFLTWKINFRKTKNAL